ncbi:MAG TPA: META domain-containing protein [Methylomirabilota bacterium]|nr:META domain-containing protein [Methylomirabilota bacterium]
MSQSITPIHIPVATALSLTLGLGACTGTRGPAPASDAGAAAPAGTTVYTCTDGYRFSTRVRADSIVVSLPHGSTTLPGVPSASGAKYAAGGVTFWSKGEEAMLETDGAAHQGCAGRTAGSPWEAALMLGIDFRAVGQEPGWVLELDEGRWLRYVGNYGATTLYAENPQAEPAEEGGAGYRVRDGERELTVTIREARCQDAMSGESFTHTVVVRLDGSELSGCGKPLMSGELTERYWKLIELNGRPAIVPQQGRETHLRLREQDRQAAGSTGCNSFSGQYEREGDRLRFGRMVTTLMACVDPALNTQEQEFLRMLEAVDRGVAVNDDLTLYAGERAVAKFQAVWLR